MNELVELFCLHFSLKLSSKQQSSLKKELIELSRKYISAAESQTVELPLFTQEQQHSQTNEIQAYSDGACQGNPGPGGWGAVIIINNECIELSGAQANTTNNRMELQAAIEALKAIKIHQQSQAVHITTDSQYVKNGISQWIYGWRKNGWKTASKEPVKNKDLWQELDALNSELKPKWLWIKGHAGHFYNERCDELAVAARKNLE